VRLSHNNATGNSHPIKPNLLQMKKEDLQVVHAQRRDVGRHDADLCRCSTPTIPRARDRQRPGRTGDVNGRSINGVWDRLPDPRSTRTGAFAAAA
jgi:hypothetical protein